jgi:hypothetical protein
MELNDVKDFKQPIITILEDFGGVAKLKDIYEQFASKYPDLVNAPYWNEIVDSDLRWHDSINRCRFQILKPQKILKNNSKKGTWELNR